LVQEWPTAEVAGNFSLFWVVGLDVCSADPLSWRAEVRKVRFSERRQVVAATVVRKKGSVTIPADIRKAARLAEGDPIEVEMTEDGILLRPQKVIDATQAWFWEAAWQAGEREADADIAAGRFDRFAGDDALMLALDQQSKPLDADT
jgi:antitoxin PrlF